MWSPSKTSKYLTTLGISEEINHFRIISVLFPTYCIQTSKLKTEGHQLTFGGLRVSHRLFDMLCLLLKSNRWKLLSATSEQMEPDWGTASVFTSRPSTRNNQSACVKSGHVTSPATTIQIERRKESTTESSRSASPVIQMPPKNFYNYPDRYYEHRPSLFQVSHLRNRY